jgi:hypothetical protein
MCLHHDSRISGGQFDFGRRGMPAFLRLLMNLEKGRIVEELDSPRISFLLRHIVDMMAYARHILYVCI